MFPLEKPLAGKVVQIGLPKIGAVATQVFTSTGQKKWWQSLAKLLKRFPQVFFLQQTDQTVTNSVAEITILGTGVSSITLPANYFTVGKTIRMKVGGIYSSPAGATSILFNVKLGAIVIATVTTTSLPVAGATNFEFDIDLLVTCRTVGVGGTVMVHGDVEYATGAGTVALDPLNNAGAVTVVDTTIANTLNITATWDAATPTRSITSTIAVFEVVD